MIFLEGIKVYGDLDYRNKKCPSEDAELETFVNQIRKLYPDFARVMIHVPNEGKRKGYEVENLKKKGALNFGASDIIIIGKQSFVMEMKRMDHTLSKWQPGQMAYLKAAKELDSFACVCLGWEAAMMAFNDWRAMNYPNYKKQSEPLIFDGF